MSLTPFIWSNVDWMNILWILNFLSWVIVVTEVIFKILQLNQMEIQATVSGSISQKQRPKLINSPDLQISASLLDYSLPINVYKKEFRNFGREYFRGNLCCLVITAYLYHILYTSTVANWQHELPNVGKTDSRNLKIWIFYDQCKCKMRMSRACCSL